MNPDELRTIALARLKARADFHHYLLVWLGVTILVSAVWAVSGFGYYWPAWVIFGMGIGAFVSALRAYGPGRNGITESAVDAEVARVTAGR